MSSEISEKIIAETKILAKKVDALKFSAPVAFVYNPLVYAEKTHEAYLKKFCLNKKRVIFIGMNPGPFGMAQTGIPFGEINAVQNWLGIFDFVGNPPREHPAKRVEGFACRRSEVSGKRLWGLFEKKFQMPENFFAEHFVVNFCPLLFVAGNERGKNLTPEDLVPAERAAVLAPCDEFLRKITEILEPEWLVGVGNFAKNAAERACSGVPVKVSAILHPSPASPLANKNWAEKAESALVQNGVWKN